MIHCASRLKGRIILVSRDSDYGYEYEGSYFLNDQLKREFRERVGRRASLIYTHKLSDALRELDVPVTEKEVKSEEPVLSISTAKDDYFNLMTEIKRMSELSVPVPDFSVYVSNASAEIFKSLQALREINITGLLDVPEQDDEDNS